MMTSRRKKKFYRFVLSPFAFRHQESFGAHVSPFSTGYVYCTSTPEYTGQGIMWPLSGSRTLRVRHRQIWFNGTTCTQRLKRHGGCDLSGERRDQRQGGTRDKVDWFLSVLSGSWSPTVVGCYGKNPWKWFRDWESLDYKAVTVAALREQYLYLYKYS